MATAMTFNSLLKDVRNYLERGYSVVTDPIVFDTLPFLVNLAERRISRDIKVQGFQNVVLVTLPAGTTMLAKPDRWRETLTFAVTNTATGRQILYARAYEYLRTHYPTDNIIGIPQFYADYDYQHWLIAPASDEIYNYEIIYNEISEYLNETNQTNWVTEYAPNLLLYATLLEATPFLKNDERIATWQTFYDKALIALNAEDNKKIIDRSAARQEV